ncbi:MAG TPA: serine hydrolase domain-containing protein [Caulobacteraceae bacterium]|jgi:CubicO group peptidase (beta-lactamase class C family)
MAATALEDLAAYAASQNTTGLVLMQGGRMLLEHNWPAADPAFAAVFVRGETADGALIEDVASQQKSLIALLLGQAIDRGLLNDTRPVADIVGAGWTKASPAEEGAIAVRHLLQMTSGLTEQLAVEAPPGQRFFYNTPAYARLQRVLEVIAGQPLDALTRDWLSGPLGMADTAWLPRPADLAQRSGNAWGLATAPRDLAKLGGMVLDGGLTPNGTRLISPAALADIFTPTATNPAYGRLWWLNNGAWSIDPQGARREGRWVPSAPATWCSPSAPRAASSASRRHGR